MEELDVLVISLVAPKALCSVPTEPTLIDDDDHCQPCIILKPWPRARVFPLHRLLLHLDLAGLSCLLVGLGTNSRVPWCAMLRSPTPLLTG